jgi:hypothetical protein
MIMGLNLMDTAIHVLLRVSTIAMILAFASHMILLAHKELLGPILQVVQLIKCVL